MEIRVVQEYLRRSNQEMQKPFTTGPEVMMTIIEELGEVSTEIQLIEQIGSKAAWEREPSKDRLAEEMTHLLNVILVLANLYTIDLDAIYTKRLQEVFRN